jgi:hypothetical protein
MADQSIFVEPPVKSIEVGDVLFQGRSFGDLIVFRQFPENWLKQILMIQQVVHGQPGKSVLMQHYSSVKEKPCFS